ncbi:MFS transporter [Catenulispora yoronensis]
MSDQARRGKGVLPALVLSVLAFSLVQTSVVPILPTLQKDLDVAGSGITWLMTANLLSAAVLTPLLARVGDLRGRKPVLVVAIAGVLAGGVLGGIGGSFQLLLIARVLAGTGGAILPLAVAVVRDELPREKVTGGVALISASSASARAWAWSPPAPWSSTSTTRPCSGWARSWPPWPSRWSCCWCRTTR